MPSIEMLHRFIVLYAWAQRLITEFVEVPVGFKAQTSAPVTRLPVSFKKSSPRISP